MRLKVGPIRYKVTYVRDLRDDDKSKLDGRISHTLCEVQIERNMVAQAKAQTMLHEAVHAIALQCGMTFDEAQVDSLAYSIYGLVRENPQLVKLIND